MEKGANMTPAIKYDIEKGAFVKTYYEDSFVRKVQNSVWDFFDKNNLDGKVAMSAIDTITYEVLLASILDPKDEIPEGTEFEGKEILHKKINGNGIQWLKIKFMFGCLPDQTSLEDIFD